MATAETAAPEVEPLLERIRAYRPEARVERVREAYRYAREAHQGQTRVSGEPYIEHPLAVAQILADLELDTETIMAGILHDVVEDTGRDLADIEERFGAEVARLVDGVTKLSQLEYRSREEEQAENLRKMFLAMAKDIRVILIKLSDRLHNMRTLKSLAAPRQQKIARETLDIFAPLAHRLGMFQVKWELEDLSLRYLEPTRYKELAEKVARKRAEREDFIQKVADALEERLSVHGIEAEITGRPKNFYSIYKKMYEQGKEFSQIYDLIAVRVIVESIKDCYGVLGIVHTLWKPIPGRFKDYIAMPKSNLYQSLHTTVIGPAGEPFEVQIRTREMHRTAEYGIAAHWRYKEGRQGDEFDQKLTWLRQVLEWQHDLKDAREFMDTLKIDLFADEVFVFTPKGAVVDLPAGATPVDFAYRIHTDIGHRCVGAKVSGRIVPLDHKLKNGDILEILTSKQAQGPSADWLTFVKTSGARNRIRAWFKAKNREENLQTGKEMLEREAKRLGLEPRELLKNEWLEDVRKKLNFGSVEDMLVAIGYGGFSPGQVIGRLKEKRPQPLPEAPPEKVSETYGRPTGGVRILGVDNVLVRFAHCCTPVPGDSIFGYVTRGRGISIHRAACPNAADLQTEKDRIVPVVWDEDREGTYPVEVEIHAVDRVGLLADVAGAVAEAKVNIIAAKVHGFKNGTTLVTATMGIHHLGELHRIMDRIARVSGVMNVERVQRQEMEPHSPSS